MISYPKLIDLHTLPVGFLQRCGVSHMAARNVTESFNEIGTGGKARDQAAAAKQF
jgi:hypothetical protein